MASTRQERKPNRRRRFEERQYKNLTHKLEVGQPAWYFIITMIIIILVDLLDNFTTSSTSNLTSSIVNDFFVNGTFLGKHYTYEEGLALHNTISLFCNGVAVAAPFYKSLGDKYGRKPLFVISTCGMALGMLVVYASKNYIVYLIGSTMMMFFLGNDIQIIYVLEESPARHRAKIYSVLKAIGAMGVVFIPVLRNLVMHNDPARWREIFYLPGLAGLMIGVIVLLFAKETRVFVNQRQAYLSIPFEERIEKEEREKAEKKANANKNGVFNAIRYIWQKKDIRNLLLAKTIFDTAMVAMTYYESVMYKAGMSTGQITTAEYFYPFMYAGSLLIAGVIADKFGRKRTIQLYGTVCIITFITFLLSSNRLMDPVFVGIANGLYLGSYWIGRDYMEIMVTEMVPTDIRASVIAGAGVAVLAGIVFGYAFSAIAIQFIPIWMMCAILAVPTITVSLFMLTFKVPETMGTDYNDIKE